MSVSVTGILGLSMAALSLLNAGLMAWLWRFPMVPDPTGRDPHGVSTAPRSWKNVHRALGWIFLAIYGVLLVEMLPRLWEFREVSIAGALHGFLGLAVGALLVAKILVIRRARRFGNRLPLLGGTLTAVTISLVALAGVPAWRLFRPLTPLSPELAEGRGIVARKCLQCHGASTISGEREDARKWDRITLEMQRRSGRAGRIPILEAERILATAYLSHVLGEESDREESGRRRRRDRD